MAEKLKSKLFTEADPATVKKLQDCADGRPSEVVSHFVEGKAEGNHIRRIQQALKNAAAKDPTLVGIPAFSVNGIYDKDFADAIEFYKGKREILNFAGKIDRIVGIKTIRSLDVDEDKAKQPERPSGQPEFPTRPTSVPRALPNCAPRSAIQPAREFSVSILGMLIGGEGIEFSAIFWAIRDLSNTTPLSSLYRTTGFGLGTPSGAPATLTGGGKPTNFTLDRPAKICDFQTVQIVQATSVVLPLPPDPKVPQPIPLPNLTQKGIAGVILQVLLPNGGTTSTTLMEIDTGIANLQGAGGQFGFMTNLTICGTRKERGAVRREIGVADIGRF
jgi:hypothetical protein